MGLIDKLFGSTHEQSKKQPQHAVIIYFNYGMESLDPLFELCDKLERVIEESAVGEFDGHEIAVDGSDGSLYMYGPNAETLFKAVKPALDETAFIKGGVAKLRFGPVGENAYEIDIEL
jgi:hypothetical protein